uniref:GYF domain-containing protein n=1 Tax=Spongospora subterranea TaxID=70186 RepID=A0A0H5QJL4_9EUKA|eukprot:CRZ01521.1 hypothetical protein [Spongospora subterranea]
MRGINGKREAKVQFDNDAGLQSDDDDGENEDIGRNGRFRAIEQDDSGSEDEIEETAKAKKRAQFERGVGNVPVEGEEDSTPAPDGFEPFNMKDERARGWFDGAGNFNVESEDVREAWLKDFEEKQTEDTDSCVPDSTVDLTRKGVKRYRQNVVAADEENDDVIDPVHERQVLLRHMIQNENVLGALKRLGKVCSSKFSIVKLYYFIFQQNPWVGMIFLPFF